SAMDRARSAVGDQTAYAEAISELYERREDIRDLVRAALTEPGAPVPDQAQPLPVNAGPLLSANLNRLTHPDPTRPGVATWARLRELGTALGGPSDPYEVTNLVRLTRSVYLPGTGYDQPTRTQMVSRAQVHAVTAFARLGTGDPATMTMADLVAL